jgi:hypothetical protein
MFLLGTRQQKRQKARNGKTTHARLQCYSAG